MERERPSSHHSCRSGGPRGAAPPLGYQQAERLEALRAPWPWRYVRYLLWLSMAMDSWWGFVLFILTFAACVGLLCLVSWGAWALLAHHLGWILACAGTGALSIVGRAIWTDAVATERRYRVVGILDDDEDDEDDEDAI